MTDAATYPSLAGRNVFITGGGAGIGAAMVAAFSAQGAHVSFVDIADCGPEVANETGAHFTRVDVRDIDQLRNAIKDCAARHGPIDVLINNVANDVRHDWRDVTPDDWNNNHDINLRPAFFAIQTALPGMIAAGRGSVINFGSISWKVKAGEMLAYTTAKSAAHGLTRSFVAEAGAAGVRVNTIMPGWIMTEKQRRLYYNDEGRAILAQNQPLTGLITPEDVADLALFLGSDNSRMCTGQEFTIDGGWT